jgi:nicotinate-nucleotide adenylyltransferase
LGGSFDPAHAGHVHITREALKRFGLDQLWWLVSPGNPLKQVGPAALRKRMQHARNLMQHPKVRVTELEALLGTRYTAQTLKALVRRYPGVRFVWLMGADNLAQFHLWHDWHSIIQTTPIGVLARPGQQIRARTSPAAKYYAYARSPAQLLARAHAPAWSFITMPLSTHSSSAIRARGEWG